MTTQFLDVFTMLCRIQGAYKDDVALTDPLVAPRVSAEVGFTDGDGADQVQLYFQEQLTLTSGSPTKTYNLADDTMRGPFGRTLAFTAIKGMFFIPAVTNITRARVGAAAADPWESWTDVPGSEFKVEPGSPVMHVNRSAAGWLVGAGNDQLKITNPTVSSDSVILDVFLIGLGVAT